MLRSAESSTSGVKTKSAAVALWLKFLKKKLLISEDESMLLEALSDVSEDHFGTTLNK